ncbi:hypothetical protein AOL_s00080g210 [Orbilia oligospora ATCC 24927]|uniref:Uncharacterized protein n=1 Tax=Arthrobotrys oligospora (strain ATCC 24927 / CBS 115.81 / DSM 1491) TaxID=756982 RepID=G1XEH5_ARTOA|nr:hypothetical protein AOL_s00080g210 [Orbilia oligospora ATCC 24927]EGX48581.1 hypothetical protein AOL_s00080g210 [Orbilia oligospora ATCC 24927]
MRFKKVIKRLKHFCCCCRTPSISSDEIEEAPRLAQNPNFDGTVDGSLDHGRSEHDETDLQDVNSNITSDGKSDTHLPHILEFDFQNSPSKFTLELNMKHNNYAYTQEYSTQNKQQDPDSILNIKMIELEASSHPYSLEASTVNTNSIDKESQECSSTDFGIPELSTSDSIQNSRCTCNLTNSEDVLTIILERLEQIEKTQRDFTSKLYLRSSNFHLTSGLSVVEKCEVPFQSDTETSALVCYTGYEILPDKNLRLDITDAESTVSLQGTAVGQGSLATCTRTDKPRTDPSQANIPSAFEFEHKAPALITPIPLEYEQSKSTQMKSFKAPPSQERVKSGTSKNVNYPRTKPRWKNSRDPNLRRPRPRGPPRPIIGGAPKPFFRACCIPKS